jgi:hypothetical protein
VGCSSPNSQRSPRCHWSEMDLTCQRLVTFLRGETCAGVLQAGLRQLVSLSDRSLPDGGPCICALACVHDIVPVFDLQDFLPVQPYLNKRLVLFWEPETINLLILPQKLCVLDPEGEFRRGMPFDAHHGVVVCINPDSTFKQILGFPLGYSFGDKTAVRPKLLFAQKIQGIVVGRNGAVMMLFAGGGFDLAIISGFRAICRTNPEPDSEVTVKVFLSGEKNSMRPISSACTFPLRSTT